MGQIYKKIPEYLDKICSNNKIVGAIIEIGSSRPGDDNSSPYLNNLAKELNTTFITCDIDQRWVDTLTKNNINATCDKGEDFLKSYYLPVSIAYLDNFDWDWHPANQESWLLDQIEHYKSQFDIEMNNVASQSAHLLQSIRLEQLTMENSLIVFDDTWYNQYWGHYTGKGGAAIPYLVAKGYSVLYTEEYGTILGRFTK